MNKFLNYKIVIRVKSWVAAHKAASAAIAVFLILSGYWAFGKLTGTDGETRYVLGTIRKGTIVISTSGSGQVSASNQVDVKSKASGEVIYIGVKSGQEVKAGTLIAQLDARDAQKAVRDAEASLESAKITLEKLKGPEGLAIPRNKEQAQENLKKSYEDGFNTVSNAFLDLPSVISGVKDILYGENFSKGQWNADYFANAVNKYDEKIIQFRDDAYAKYQSARKAYDENFNNYKSASRFSDEALIESLIEETYNTVKIMAEAVKSANNFIQFYKDKLTDRALQPDTLASAFLSNLDTYTGKTNSHLLNLLSAKNSIKNYRDAVLNADLDIRAQELSIKQRENSFLDAREKLADYYIRAPLEGSIAKLNVKKLDSVTSATVVATLITKQKFAEISLNEVDISKVRVGQKAALTFDAVEGLDITGEVAEVDAIGTVSQGVVTYNVKIVFGAEDARIKPGMSVNASIITDTKADILLAPNSAVKSMGNYYYVEMFDSSLSEENNQNVISSVPPRRQTVEIGLSNDISTEIISGLEEGARIVVRTVNQASVPAAQTAPSIFQATGGNRSGGGGGTIRIPR